MLEDLERRITTIEADLKKHEDECKKLRRSLDKYKQTIEIYKEGAECGTQIMAMYNGLKASGMPDDLAREFLWLKAGIKK